MYILLGQFYISKPLIRDRNIVYDDTDNGWILWIPYKTDGPGHVAAASHDSCMLLEINNLKEKQLRRDLAARKAPRFIARADAISRGTPRRVLAA